MRTVYIADDGKEFDDECECQDYEFASSLNAIEIYDEDGNKLKDLLSDDTYYEARKIIINTEKELSDLRLVADYTGFYGYERVTSAGVWIYDEDSQCFIQYSHRAFFKDLSDKYVEKLKKYDSEENYIYRRDGVLMDLLTELGYEEVVEAYNKVSKWYS